MSETMGLQVWQGHDGRGPVALGVSGALTPLDVDGAKQVSHDAAIAQAGRLRAGPVHWVILDYHSQGLAYLEQLGIDAQQLALHEFLRRSAVSVLVIAGCATDKRPPRAKRRRR